ncbi:aminotransferase class I/II-fold pyridoxal phosphate-dependent enzyme [Streptomyces sp. NPDC089919]|uniref:aminotransferase class I/II-fold pyridoxal phosphate-dependent enzyme n=1 Tax=Streptomyces sp. NPDC089919 TaxID=3155188 RepID=UPI00344A3F07
MEADGAVAQVRRAVPEGRGPVRFGPPAPGTGLPVLPELTAVLAAAADRGGPEPPGGGAPLRLAARGFWERRGLYPGPAGPDRIAAAPGAPALLLALLGAFGGDVLLPRPCPAWWTPTARLLGRRAFHVPTPAECGGVPDPYALLETVRRVRAEGGDPRVLLLSVADDPTGTVAPPEVLRAACEAAVSEGLAVISDETWRETVHRPHETVLVSPAEMCPQDVTVLVDLAGSLLPAGWPAAVARFPGTPAGHRLHARTLDVLAATGALLAAPVAAAAGYALTEPPPVAARAAAAARAHGAVAAAMHRILLGAGALARPPQAGRHLYADLTPLRAGLARHGVGDALELEDHLSSRLGVLAPGGQRFGDELGAPRARLATEPLLGGTESERLAALRAEDPLAVPHVQRSMSDFGSVFDELS